MHQRHRRGTRTIGKRIISVKPQATSEINTPSPVHRTLPMEPQAKVEDNTRPVGTTLEISSVNEVFSQNPLTFNGKLNHAPVHILINSGAMGNFISQQTADHFSFALHDVSNIPIVFANSVLVYLSDVGFWAKSTTSNKKSAERIQVL